MPSNNTDSMYDIIYDFEYYEFEATNMRDAVDALIDELYTDSCVERSQPVTVVEVIYDDEGNKQTKSSRKLKALLPVEREIF